LEGSRKGASLFAGALLGGLLSGDPEGHGRRAQGTDITLRGALLGGLLSGDPEGHGRRAQGTDITLRGDPVGEFSRGLVYRGLAKALETGTFLHRGHLK